MTIFPDAEHAASWGGLCPGNRQSGGKRLSGRTRKANPYLRRALAEAAWAASHTKNCFLAALYRRLRGRLGHNPAIFALAHQILRVAYTMLRRGENYRELGGDYYDRQNKPRVVHRMVERLTHLGYEVQLKPVLEPQPMPPLDAGAADPAPQLPETSPAKRGRGRPCKCAERGIPCQHNRIKSEVAKTEPTEPKAGLARVVFRRTRGAVSPDVHLRDICPHLGCRSSTIRG